MTATITGSRVGPLLREWRLRRRLTQLDLALEAGVSARHLSFVETGRARPSAELVLNLAEHLDVPLRDRNALLLAAGYAPVYGQRGLDEPEMGPVRAAIDQVLAGHEPYPALVVDRHWGMVAANRAVGLLMEGIAPELLEPPVNVLRASLHPDGLAPRIVNLAEWRAHLLDRLGRQAVSTGDPALAALHEELSALPGGGPAPSIDLDAGAIAVPLRLRAGDRELAFISTVTTFGTAIDITVSELSIESFFPADEATAAALRALAPGEDETDSILTRARPARTVGPTVGFFRAVRCSATVATATITAARQIAETTDDEPVFELDLAVSREGAAPYTATVRAVVPPERLARVHPGRRVRVQVDPADPDALRVDWDARP